MTDSHPAQDRTLAENRLAIILSAIVTVIVCVWIANADSAVRYALYALPALMILTCAMVMEWRVAVDSRGLLALALYASTASLTLASNHYPGETATRDLLVITGYLVLFTVTFRAPRFIADASLIGLALATVVVAINNDVLLNVSFLASGGVLESPLAFPLGLVFLYFTGQRQWGRAAIAFVLFFLAFKRIAILGAVGALAVEFAVAMLTGRRLGRILSFCIVVAVSIFALFLLQIFDHIAVVLNNENISAGSISLGRSDYATTLWRGIHDSGFTQFLFGSGPGAADLSLATVTDQPNPHNDWLKILFDYGMVGFIALHAVLYLIHPDTAFGNRAYIYLAVVMATDNPLIYVFYYVYLFLLLRIGDGAGARR